MNVIHIATTDFGGAAQGMLNLHYALLERGVNSKILVAEKTTNIGSIYKMEPNFQTFKWSRFNLIRRIQHSFRKRGKLKTVVEYWNDKISIINAPDSICYTSPFTNYDITQHPLVKEAEIIHLHWVGNFLDYTSFFRKTNKPIVWTLRDENPGLGGFHYTSDKNNYGSYYDHIERHFLETKRISLIHKSNITLVALSDVMKSFCSKVDFLANKRIIKIYNPINCKTYNCIDHQVAKKVLNIEDDAFVVSFVSVSLKDHRKGLTKLLDAINQINKSIKLLCVGINDFFDKEHSNVVCYGRIENQQLLSIIYSASDVFVTPSLQESFGKTTVEAMLCGTPVISTKTGIATEIINEDCGIFIESVDTKDIIDAINLISERQYDRNNIQKRASSLFNPSIIAKEHIELYNSILDTKNY